MIEHSQDCRGQTVTAARLRRAVELRYRRLRTLLIRRRLGRLVARLDTAGYVLVANNCVAGILYETAGLPKRTPTVGMFFRGDAYAAFLDGLADRNLSAWTPIRADELVTDERTGSPVLMRGGKPAVVFLHYHDPAVAAEKWNDRFSRLEGREPIVIASLRDGIEEAMLARAKAHFRHLFVIGPAPAPPADAVILDARLLDRLAAFLDGVLRADGR